MEQDAQYISAPDGSSRETGSRVSTQDVLLTSFVGFWLVLAISPLSRADWLLENLLVFVAVPVLFATRKHMRFTTTSYVCLFSFFVFHSIGAHYTYAMVPYDRWWEWATGSTISGLFGWERNHYDRLVHFLYGALMLPPSAELLQRYAPARAGWRWAMPVLFITSHSAIYETIEWIAALIAAPDLGSAYLGTQGDEWDAQQGMGLAIVGAISSTILMCQKRFIQRHAS